MNKIDRSLDVINSTDDLEHLYTFKDFPVFMGCTDAAKETDILTDMSWWISKSSGMVQLTPLIPLEIVYKMSHGSGSIGRIWAEHHLSLAKFISKINPSQVLEIGGGHGELSKAFNTLSTANWTIVEPNPSPVDGVTAEYIKEFFDEKFTINLTIDTVVHSHVFEHMYDPDLFMNHLSMFVKPGSKMIFSIPNMQAMLERYYTNMINFEHTIILTEPFIEFLLAKYGFKVLEKEYFLDDHSIFYATERLEISNPITLPTNLYNKNKELFIKWVEHLTDFINILNATIASTDKPIYLFGAHVFSQHLIALGSNTEKIICLLDNDTKKQNKRLYGSDLVVNSPTILKDVTNPLVILRAGVFSQEIKRDILENINPNTEFLL